MALSQSLRDIQARLRAVAPTGGAGGAAEQQQAMQKMLQSKTGKAKASTGPKASAVAARQTGAELEAAAKEQALQGAAQAEQLGVQAASQQDQLKLAQERLAAQKRMTEGERAVGGALAREQMAAGAERQRKQLTANEEMKINSMASAFSQRTADLASQRGITVDNIFSEYDRSNKQLEFRKDAAELEQLAFDLDMSNRELLEEYQAIWAVQNLQDDLTFQKEYAKIHMGENTTAVLKQLGWQRAADADVRAFNDQVSRMNINDALAIANASLQDSQKQMIASGIMTGAQAAAKYDWGGGTTSSVDTATSIGEGSELQYKSNQPGYGSSNEIMA
jgi:hypothetical protein